MISKKDDFEYNPFSNPGEIEDMSLVFIDVLEIKHQEFRVKCPTAFKKTNGKSRVPQFKLKHCPYLLDHKIMNVKPKEGVMRR